MSAWAYRVRGDAAGSYDEPMCVDDSPASLAAAIRHDVEPAIEIDLEPVDSVGRRA